MEYRLAFCAAVEKLPLRRQIRAGENRSQGMENLCYIIVMLFVFFFSNSHEFNQQQLEQPTNHKSTLRLIV